jgi:Kdo2-lipid IVA lauroyltransferase/acyltransferase
MTGKKISYYLFLLFNYLVKITPFWLLYRISDVVYLILFYIVSYRKSAVIKNFKRCFPNKSEKELKVLRKKFYKILSDLFLETFKGFSMSKKEIIERFKVINDNVANKYFDQGKDVIILLGHFANWEWAIAPAVEQFKHQSLILYKPISNHYIDKFTQNKRTRLGAELVPINATGKAFMKKKPKPGAYYLVGDQYPPIKERQKMATFFSSQTAFLDGAEKYSKLLNIPVVYMELQRIKRGYYSMEIMDVCENPKDLAENELTQIYASLMEKSIKKQPENWIWSHKRWKYELYDA